MLDIIISSMDIYSLTGVHGFPGTGFGALTVIMTGILVWNS